MPEADTLSAAPYRLGHGSPLTQAEAAQLLTRAAAGEALQLAPVKRGHRWALAHLQTLSAADLSAYRARVELTAQLLAGGTVPALMTA